METWYEVSSSRIYVLTHAYFTAFKMDKEKRPSDVLYLHFEPANVKNDVKSELKIGPHLHIRDVEAQIHKCHFPLREEFNQRVLKSVNEFTDVFSKNLNILKIEVFE